MRALWVQLSNFIFFLSSVTKKKKKNCLLNSARLLLLYVRLDMKAFKPL